MLSQRYALVSVNSLQSLAVLVIKNGATSFAFYPVGVGGLKRTSPERTA